MKKTLFITLIIVLSMTACSKSGGSSGSGSGGGQEERLTGKTDSFTFRLMDDGTYSVSAGTAAKGTVNIPASYRPDTKSDYLPVTNIGIQGFRESGIINVTIPNSVTSIDTAAFSGCTSLASITLPASVTVIGSAAFAGCTNITAITIPAGVTYVGQTAFGGWTAGQTINIQGKANREAAIAAGWEENWGYDCKATINYGQ
jgi:hypothetical protein